MCSCPVFWPASLLCLLSGYSIPFSLLLLSFHFSLPLTHLHPTPNEHTWLLLGYLGAYCAPWCSLLSLSPVFFYFGKSCRNVLLLQKHSAASVSNFHKYFSWECMTSSNPRRLLEGLYLIVVFLIVYLISMLVTSFQSHNNHPWEICKCLSPLLFFYCTSICIFLKPSANLEVLSKPTCISVALF